MTFKFEPPNPTRGNSPQKVIEGEIPDLELIAQFLPLIEASPQPNTTKNSSGNFTPPLVEFADGGLNLPGKDSSSPREFEREYGGEERLMPPENEIFKDQRCRFELTANFNNKRASLPDCELATEMSRFHELMHDLPAGEVRRLVDRAITRLEKWPSHILKIAPELYKKRPADEKLAEFLVRVYVNAGHITENNGFSIVHLEALDEPLGKAVRFQNGQDSNWLSTHGIYLNGLKKKNSDLKLDP